MCSNYTSAEESLLENVQLAAAHIVTGAMAKNANSTVVCREGLGKSSSRRDKRSLILMYKIVNNETSGYLQGSLPQGVNRTSYKVRNRENLTHFRNRTTNFNNSFFPATVSLWNQLPLHIRQAEHI